ncbi:hypothetical protein M3Y98_01176800 [Aphelenchoides besseyi]|nr:hypothetical protein M3Y98_01176800 [Aphelenchoides besseyi]KAI6211026.1 hypothetical protein M3Y96_00389800 [Aphelenchoides besseyi]
MSKRIYDPENDDHYCGVSVHFGAFLIAFVLVVFLDIEYILRDKSWVAFTIATVQLTAIVLLIVGNRKLKPTLYYVFLILSIVNFCLAVGEIVYYLTSEDDAEIGIARLDNDNRFGKIIALIVMLVFHSVLWILAFLVALMDLFYVKDKLENQLIKNDEIGSDVAPTDLLPPQPETSNNLHIQIDPEYI